MAEGAQQNQAPTFKLVLVGDGGTGKVSLITQIEDAAMLLCDYCTVEAKGTAVLTAIFFRIQRN